MAISRMTPEIVTAQKYMKANEMAISATENASPIGQ